MKNLVQKYLVLNKYINEEKQFDDLFSSHPNYPSLYAITDSLDILGIENVAAKIEKNQLLDLPVTFLAYLKIENDNQLGLVTKRENDVIITNEKLKNTIYTFQEFDDNWNGIILVVEPNENNSNSITKISSRNSNFYLIPALAVIVIICLSFYNFKIDYSTIPYLLGSILGSITSIFIIQEKLGFENETISKICNGLNTSCDSVIKSKNSKLTRWASFSDLPLLFFFSNLISVILNPESTFYLGAFSLLSFPILIYSVWLQKAVVKKWCTLCLITISLILFQGLFFAFNNKIDSIELIPNTFYYSSAIIITSTVWFFIKPFIEEKIKIEKENKNLNRFKRNFKIFDSLSKEIAYIPEFNELKGIEFGNPQSQVKLTLLLSPSCGHCHKAFEDGLDLISKYPDKFFLSILFNINPHNNDNPYRTIVENLIAINSVKNSNIKEAIYDWHINKMDLIDWLKKWGGNFISDQVTNQIEMQYNWCLENDLNYTPVKIINNKLFPNEYELTDLIYFSNDLLEENNKNVQLELENTN